jgi:serine/threonine protein kinase
MYPEVAEMSLVPTINSELLAVKMIRDAQQKTTAQHYTNVPIIKEVFHDDDGPWRSWYSTELVDGLVLSKLVSWPAMQGVSIPAWLVAHIFLEILQGLKWLAAIGLCHGDLHIRNLMLGPNDSTANDQRPRVVLIDFGSATEITSQREMEDSERLLHIMKAMVRQGIRDHGDWIQQPDDEQTEMKNELLGAVRRAFEDGKTSLDGIWDACAALAERIRRESGETIPAVMKLEIEKGVREDARLEVLIEKGGEPVELVGDSEE